MSPLGAKKVEIIADGFCTVLDGLDEEMNHAYKALVKAGVNVGSWKGKKSGVSDSS